jgi:hypothetical protein
MLSLNIIYFHYQVNIIAQKGKKSEYIFINSHQYKAEGNQAA